MSESEIVIPIRYDGMDAERHQVELYSLGESLQGMARILAVVGHFAATGEYAKQMQALDAKVYLKETRGNCVTVDAVLEVVKGYGLADGTLAAIVTGLVTWLFQRGASERADMRAIKDTADKLLASLADSQRQRDLLQGQTVDRLAATIDRMADALRPSLKAAVAPIGRSCKFMTVGAGAAIDEAMADAIRSEVATDVTPPRQWQIVITEMDLETATAKVRLIGEDESSDNGRVKAKITDPAFGVAGDIYRRAFAVQSPLTATAKATLRDGEIQTLFITDAK